VATHHTEPGGNWSDLSARIPFAGSEISNSTARHGTQAVVYGTEGREFESLRARWEARGPKVIVGDRLQAARSSSPARDASSKPNREA
jgi:hypothetical protein